MSFLSAIFKRPQAGFHLSFWAVFGEMLVAVFAFGLLLLRPQLEYLLVQARGQLKLSFSAMPLKEALQNPALSLTEKQGLLFGMQVLDFAKSQGLNTKGAYLTYADSSAEPQMWMLSASKPLAFESYSWSFPFFGGFSYKGFFDLEMALHEKRKLDALGYDVDLGKASAWSTLGWFPDPITASMLKKKPYDFAELLFHELVHKTVYLNDSVEWNENLAVLCARQLCLDFLMKMNRKDLHDEYLQSLRAEDSLLAFAFDRQARLRAFYASDACSLSGKSILIRQYAQEFLDKEWSRFFPREKVAAAMLYERNAWFLSHQRYGGGMTELHEQLYHQHHGSVKDFLEKLVQHYGQ